MILYCKFTIKFLLAVIKLKFFDDHMVILYIIIISNDKFRKINFIFYTKYFI